MTSKDLYGNQILSVLLKRERGLVTSARSSSALSSDQSASTLA